MPKTHPQASNSSSQSSPREVGNNAAGRLFNFFSNFKRRATSHAAIRDNWQEALHINEKHNDARDEHAIGRAHDAISREIDAIASAVRAHGVPDSLTSSHLNHLRGALSLNLFNQGRDHTLQYVNNEALLTLRWCSIVLPDEDDVVSSEAMDVLRHQIRELEEALALEGIPPHFRAYAEEVLRGLESALFLFPIQGIKPLQQTVRQAVSNAHFEEESLKAEFEENDNKPEVETLRQKMGNALKSAATLVGDVEKLSKGYGYLLGKAHEAGVYIANGISQSSV